MKKIFFLNYLLLCLFSLCLSACATTHPTPTPRSPRVMSELQQGKRYFEDGYYKSALKYLLPLAAECEPEAEYAVGYMYYYGYGVAQDTDVGYFWIKRSADQHFAPAEKALTLISQNKH
jgi:TPR repeat protein